MGGPWPRTASGSAPAPGVMVGISGSRDQEVSGTRTGRTSQARPVLESIASRIRSARLGRRAGFAGRVEHLQGVERVLADVALVGPEQVHERGVLGQLDLRLLAGPG